MKVRGFTLIETLLSLSIIGIIVAIFLPNFLSGMSLFTKAKEEAEMIYFAQSIIEEIKSNKAQSIEVMNLKDSSPYNYKVDKIEQNGVLTITVLVDSKISDRTIELKTMVLK